VWNGNLMIHCGQLIYMSPLRKVVEKFLKVFGPKIDGAEDLDTTARRVFRPGNKWKFSA